MDLDTIIDDLLDDLRPLRFSPPISHVYNPLEYARAPYVQYLSLYASCPKQVVLLGMNPGPWEWLHIEAPVSAPPEMHPKRPVEGFACSRSEVSGKRLWGWARKTFGTPERFFSRFFVANYCPLLFIEASGRNRTPDNLPVADQRPLLAACDRALRRTIQWIQPRFVVGIGRFAAERAHRALSGLDVTVGTITHPSPANPKANRGWDSLIVKELAALGIQL